MDRIKLLTRSVYNSTVLTRSARILTLVTHQGARGPKSLAAANNDREYHRVNN